MTNFYFCQRTNGTFGFCRHTSQRFAKPKEPFFANAEKQITENRSQRKTYFDIFEI